MSKGRRRATRVAILQRMILENLERISPTELVEFERSGTLPGGDYGPVKPDPEFEKLCAAEAEAQLLSGGMMPCPERDQILKLAKPT